jgi:hypothetical protein
MLLLGTWMSMKKNVKYIIIQFKSLIKLDRLTKIPPIHNDTDGEAKTLKA